MELRVWDCQHDLHYLFFVFLGNAFFKKKLSKQDHAGMIIDTHQHFWKYSPTTHSWIDDDLKLLRRDFLPETLKSEYDKYAITGCIAVQADKSEAENEFLLGLASKNDFIKGVVGWLDFKNPNIKERLQEYAADTKIKGFRHLVQNEDDPNFLLRKPFMDGIAQLARYDYTYDILVFPHQLGAVLEFVQAFPDQKFVIDHLAKPYIKDGFFKGWANIIKAIGRCENVYCKLSGMVTEAGFDTWSYTAIEPYINYVLDVFGPQRLLFGSDWPVCLVAGDYGEILGLAQRFAEGLSTDEQEQFWYKNAQKFYNLT